MDSEKLNSLRKRLWELQSHICFLCEREINLDADQVEIDHIDPQSNEGLDSDSNWALMHSECNNKKRVKNLDLARSIMRFELLKESNGGALTAAQVLESRGGSAQEVYAKCEGQEITIRYDNEDHNYRIFIDPSNKEYHSFFALLPTRLLFHDNDLNPRKIVDINKLMGEFFLRNPQLHVSLCRMHAPEEGGKCKILLFDGQHKTAAQVMLGRNEILCRVFINPNKDDLKDVNKRAHKELRQIEFFRSVLDTLGQDIFSTRFKEYLDSPTHAVKSERGFIDSLEPSHRPDMEKNLQHYLKTRVRDSPTPKNRFFEYVELEKARSRVQPISYDSVEKTFFRWFLDSTPCEIVITEEIEETYPRDIEFKNLVRLMNLFADKTLIDNFDRNIGAFKIEEKVRNQSNEVTDRHLRAFRLYRPAVLNVWCELFKDAMADYFVVRGLISNDMRKERKKGKGTRILWRELSEVDWVNVQKMIDRVINHKIWIDRGTSVSDAFSQTRSEFFKRFLEEGDINGKKLLEEPINIRYISQAVGD